MSVRGPMGAETAVVRALADAGAEGRTIQGLSREVDRSHGQTRRIVQLLKLEGRVELAGRDGRTPLWRLAESQAGTEALRTSGRQGVIDWSIEPLGSVPDKEIARDLGVSPCAVGQARRRRGIPACPRQTKTAPKVPWDWDLIPLGDYPDRLLARILGVSTNAVRYARKKRGIAAWSEERLEGQARDEIEREGVTTR